MTRFDPNKRALLKATGAGLVLSAAPALPALAKASKLPASVVDRVIGTGWQFRQADTAEWLSATVPGTVHTDLLANKKIPDPFYRTNERDLQWIDKRDWEYRTTFSVGPQVMAREHIELYFEGLDTYAEVFVNDVKVLSADNMFREWTADIKSAIKPGANTLRILFRSPIEEGRKALAAYGFNLPASNDQSETGGVGNDKFSVFTRKAGYAYGWDWGPRFVTSGIWRPVHLRAWNTARINDVQLVQDRVTAEAADITAVVEIEASQAGTVTVLVTSPALPGLSARATVQMAAGVTTAKLSFSISKPKLWWTNGLGEAHLYPIVTTLTDGGKKLDGRTVNLGVRTVCIVQKPDANSGVSGGTSFYVELNGVPLFMKGANYIPNDSFLPRVTHGVYDKVVQSAVDTHMNMIRVWGGGVYEDNYFYDQCDRNGILIWQDFMFACSMYPNDAAFLDNVRQEAVQNVRRLRNHPSIAIWVGNNEIDSAWQNDVPNGGWGWKQGYDDAQKAKIWEAYDAIFHRILRETVAEHDGGRFYWPSSPLAAWDGKSGVKHADHNATVQSGDIHYWDVWWGQKPFTEYRTHIGRFMSEYGFQSFPEFNTVRTYAEPGDYDIFSEVMKAHQRSSIGNGTIKNYMERDYKVPADFRQFLYVGQVLQAEGIKVAMEAHRSRMPYCMGSLFWQINDCWPVASWSSIDYYGRWKAQQYFAVKAFREVLISPQIDDGKLSLYLVSDRLSDAAATVTLTLMDFDGKVLSKKDMPVTLKANISSLVMSQDVAEVLGGAAPETTLLATQVSAGGKVLNSNIVYFKPIKDVALPKPDLRHAVRVEGRDIVVTLSSAKLVKNLYLSLDAGEGRFSDNYFDILPGETVTVRFRPQGAMDAKTFAARLKLMHMAEIA